MLELENEIKAYELAQRIYRVQNYILEEVKQNGDMSDFKEDVMYVIHNLLERQLSKEEQTACEIVCKQQEAFIQLEQERYLKRQIQHYQEKAYKYDSLVKNIKKEIKELEKEAEEDGDEWGYISYRIKLLRKLLKGE